MTKQTPYVALIAVLLLSASTSLASAPKEPGERFVHVTFVDEAGRSVEDLAESELQVTIGGKEVEIERVLGPDQPFDIGLLMDVSPSKEGEVDPIRSATSAFVDYFPLDHPFLVLTFSEDVFVDCDWTTDRKKVDEAIWEYGLHKPGDSTRIYEAVVSAGEQKFQERRPRTAMILFTDGDDTGSKQVKPDESIRFLRTSGVLTYVIQHFSTSFHMKKYWPAPENPNVQNPLPPSGGQAGPIFIGGARSERDFAEYQVKKTYERAAAYLRDLAQAGGGGYFNISSVGELPGAYRKIAAELRGVYTIVFKLEPSTRNSFQKITVQTTRSGIYARPRPAQLWY